MPEPETRDHDYEELIACARRRIEEEWDLTGREQVVLRVLLRLSFGCGQMKACIPTQTLLAQACALHRSDVCRALGRLIRKGAVSLVRHRNEILYAIEVHCDQVPMRTAITTQERHKALQELLEVQIRRQGGMNDPDGQGRLDRILGEPEDTGRDVATFAAMLEPRSPVAEAPLDPAQLARETAALRQRLATEETSDYFTDEPHDPRTSDVARHRSGLRGEFLQVWDRLVRECMSGNNAGWSSFVRYAGKWRKRVINNLSAVHEAVADHQLRRLSKGSADEPGAWIYDQMRRNGHQLQL